MTTTITLVLGLMVATIILAGLASRLKIPYAILLVIGGALFGFIPGLPQIHLNSELVLLLFLPPLVYSSAWQASWREFRFNMRPILQLSIGLVLATTGFVAVVTHFMLGLSWAAAFVLGAILSPTDPVAASAIAQRMGLPRRIVSILEGESMVNDATGLVIYTFAVSAAVTGNFQLGSALLQFVLVSAGGLLIGLLIAWPVSILHRYIDDAPIEITMTLLTPYGVYLLAQMLHVSGVLATLAAGLYLSRRSSRFFSSSTRLQANIVWNILIFLLNGILFLLIGLQLHQVLGAVMGLPFITLIGEMLLVSLSVIIIRIVWVFPATYIPRWLSPRMRERDPYPGWRNVVIIAWTGLRAGVPLAIALALPLTLQNGQPFQERDLLIALTFGVILVTTVGQGLSLIPLIRALNIKQDGSPGQERERARAASVQAALDRLDALADEDWVPQQQFEHLRSHYENKAKKMQQEQLDGVPAGQDSGDKNASLRLHEEILQAERDAIIKLRDQRNIDDVVFREVERELDLEEQRLRAVEGA